MLALRQELGLLEAWVGELQLEHLGPDFTQRLASHCGLWSDWSDWSDDAIWAEAERAVEAFQKTSATHSLELSSAAFSESRALSVQSFRVGLHQSKAPVQAQKHRGAVVGSIGRAQRLNCEFTLYILIMLEHSLM